MEQKTDISPVRLRVGVLFIALWWAPFWAAAPVVAEWIGSDDVARVTLGIMIIQTAFGAFGVLIAGKQVLAIMKSVPKKQLAKTVWRVLAHGKLEEQV